MKIFYINATSGEGSTGRICLELANAYSGCGNQCKIFYGNGKSKSPLAIKVASNIGVKIHALLSRITGFQGCFSNYATGKIIRAIKKEKPDIVHLHNLHGNFVNTFRLLNYLANKDIATVLTLHDCNFYTGKCSHYTDAKCTGWKELCGECPQLKKDIPSYFFDCTTKMIQKKKRIYAKFKRLGVIAVSDWIKCEAEKSILKGAKIKRIYNWIDNTVFKPYVNSSNDLFVLCVSAKWGKNMPKYNDLLKLNSQLCGDVKIKVAGKIEEGITLPNNIEVVNYINNEEDMAKLYSDALVYVHLSSEDTFGKVIAESLACGTPVIVYNSTACPELVVDGSGYVVNVRDIDDVCKKINKIKTKGKGQYFQSCIKQSKRFDKDTAINETFEFYKEIIGN